MKSKLTLTLIIALIAATLTTGCSDDEVLVAYDPPPQPPQSVFTTTGNIAVYISWTAPYEGDITHFGIYRSRQELTGYDVIATVEAVENPNLDLVYYDSGYVDTDVANGQTYFYAVTSIDRAGQESDLSAESVMDTPRPQGNVRLYGDFMDPLRSGFDFQSGNAIHFEDPAADVYLGRHSGTGAYCLYSANADVFLQDAGYHSSFDAVGWAPQKGWSYIGSAELVPGHIYLVAIRSPQGEWGIDWNYAKLRVKDENFLSSGVLFQWAYQTDDNNPELAPPSDANTDVRSREAVNLPL